MAAASPRLATLSLLKMLDTCTLAVLAEMNSSAAISRLLRPAATSCRTSSSRAVRPNGWAASGLVAPLVPVGPGGPVSAGAGPGRARRNRRAI